MGAIKFTEWDGKPITKPGLYSRIPLETYHTQAICDGPSVSSSGLRTMFNESPAHFYAEWSGNPKRREEKPKPHFVLGRAVHHLMLGEPYFTKLFVERPAKWKDLETGKVFDWRKGDGGVLFADEWTKEQEDAGRCILTAQQVADIRGMAEVLATHPMIRAGALNGMVERSGFYRDKETGIWVKWRPDCIPTDSGDYTDLKTTQSVRHDKLRRTIFDYGYHQQLGLFRTGAREIGLPFTSGSLIFQEVKDPWPVRVVQLKDNMLDLGERSNRAALDAMAVCLKKGRWPGPGGDREDAEYIEVDDYLQKRIEDRLTYGIAT